MKKVLSFLLTAAMIMTLSVAAFAADNDNLIQPRISLGTSEGELVVGNNELFLVDADGRAVGANYNGLQPDSEYTFKIYYNSNSTEIRGDNAALIEGAKPLNKDLLQGGTVKLRTIKGSSAIQSAKIKEVSRGARYELEIKTRSYFGTKMNDVEYSLFVTGSKRPEGSFNESRHLFEVGFLSISDSDTDVGEGGTITINNDTPVIKKDQFTDIAKSANYKPIILEAEDGGWRYEGRVSGMPDSNFYYTYDVVEGIVNRLPDQDYKFLTFKAGVTFPTNGTMRIDVSDISNSFGSLYTYLYRDGKLTLVDTTYDSGADEVVFRTNYFGTFMITDKEITDSTLLGETEEDKEPEEEDNDTTTGNTGNTGNPNTGIDSMMNLAAALGLVTLVGAGVISRKKK